MLQGIIAGRPTILLPVIADETTGSNAIPDAMAQGLGRGLDLPVIASEIVQINKVGHTRPPRSNGWSRQPCSTAKCSLVLPISSSTIMSGWAARWQTCAAMWRRGAGPS
jgi:hypothetical protein